MTDLNKTFIKFINHLEELVVFEKLSFEDFLKKLIKLLSDLIPADSFLIYMYDKKNHELKLVGSNKKKKKELIENITMKSGEGITGWVVENQKPVVIEKLAYKDSRFKFFKELPEDKFEAFFSVPIINKEGVVGVINIQNKEKYKFTASQIGVVETLVKIVGSAFQSFTLGQKVTELENKLEERKLVEKAKGLLMKEKGLTEAKAYRIMQQEAMKKRKSIRDIAEAVILVFE